MPAIMIAEVVVAKTGRAQCKSCLKSIAKGEKKLVYMDTNPVFGRSVEKSICNVCARISVSQILQELNSKPDVSTEQDNQEDGKAGTGQPRPLDADAFPFSGKGRKAKQAVN